MKTQMTRRELLRIAGVGLAGLALAACQPKVVEVTRVVKEEVEKVVKETVVVKEAVEVEKEVTRVVEKEKVVEKVVEKGPAQLPKMKLRFGYGGWAKEMADVVIANFQSVEPNVDVEIEVIAGDFIQKLYTMAAAGTTPDAQWIADAHVMNLAHNKVMLDMKPLAEAEGAELLEDVYPAMRALGEWAGGLYMLAWAADAPVMYYNKDLFAKAGVPEPDPLGMKVDEFQLACQKLTNEAEQVYGTNIPESWWAVYVPWIVGFGGSFYNEDKTKVLIDSPQAIEACQALADLYCKYKGHVPRGAQLGGDPFMIQKSATMITNRIGCFNIRKAQVKFDWDVCLPPIQPVKHTCGSGTMGPGVSAAAQKRGTHVAAWKLVSTILKPATQRHFARQYMSIPVLMSMAKDPAWYDLPAPPANRDVFLEIFNGRAITPPQPKDPNCGTVYVGETNKIMNEAWEKMVIGCEPAATVFPEAAARINDCIARGGK
ncbi:MAG: sugar ABC transporter substrate-binding protein [Chloroflexi bacterium]|nr:sugar ABC transporter substrate-binding protein [Chloroflexota bacterium]